MSTLDRFHREMATLDGPMAIVTARSRDGRTGGCLIGFHTQASIDPARYLVCLSNKNHTYRLASDATHLGVHFLAADQLELAELFGTTCSAEVDKFAGLSVGEGQGGTPVITSCAHWFVGEVLGTLPINDHVAFGLRPVESGGPDTSAPLLGFQAVKHLDAAHDP